MLEESAIINIFFTVIKLLAIRGSFPISAVTDLWRRLPDSIKTLLTLVSNFSFNNLLMSLVPSSLNLFVLKISWKVRGLPTHLIFTNMCLKH